MPAERMPHVDHSLLARPLGFVTRLVLRAPGFVIAAGIVLAIASLVLTFGGLTFHASRLALLNPESSYNKRWLAYLDEFGEDDDAVIVVEGDDPRQVEPVLDELGAKLSADSKLFHSVLYRIEVSALRAKGLHYLSLDELRRIEHFLAVVQPAIEGNWSSFNVARRIELAAASETIALDKRPDVPIFAADQLLAALDDSARYQSRWPQTLGGGTQDDALKSHYLEADGGRVGFVLVRLTRDDQQFAGNTAAIEKLRAAIADIQSRHADVQIGLTGLPVLENDEMRSSQYDMMQATLLSLFGVACLFMAGFGGLRHPLLTVATLLLALAWSFGFVTLTVGHLNILSMSFGVVLIGLGIDFGIHYVARYLQLRRAHRPSGAALVETATSIGPGIVTGGLTTALAFATAALTDFTGIAELGIIAGGGILFCVAGALVVLPALIYLCDRRRTHEAIPAPLPLDLFFNPFLRLPRTVILSGIIVTAVIAAGATKLRYDHNLLNLQPTGLQSVEVEKRLVTDSDRSVWFAVSMADTPQRLRELKREFEKLPGVQRTWEIVSLLPEQNAEKSELVARIAERLARVPDDVPVIPVASPEDLERPLAAWQATAVASSGGPDGSSIRGVAALRQRVKSMPLRDYYERLSAYQQRDAGDLLALVRLLRAVADPVAPQWNDIPSELRTRFVGRTNRHLLKVYARGNVWEMDRLHDFVADIERVDPRVTGHPVQTYYASRQMQRSYIHAAIYALLAVAIVLMLDFRNIPHSLLAMTPVALGILQMFGVLGYFDIPLNPANMIVLPLILGIGIDDGVHVVHDYLRQTGRYRLSRSTAAAVVLTSATTIVGFGTMMLARHQGLRSLGQVLTIGVFCCLGTSIFILPAILAWVTRHRPEAALTGGDPAEVPPIIEPPVVELRRRAG